MIQKAPFTGHHVNLGARTGSSPKSQEWFKPPHPAGTSTWVLNLQTLPGGQSHHARTSTRVCKGFQSACSRLGLPCESCLQTITEGPLQAVTSTWIFNLQSLMECPLQVRTSTRVLNLPMLLEGLPHARLSGWALLTVSLAETTDLTHNSQGLHTKEQKMWIRRSVLPLLWDPKEQSLPLGVDGCWRKEKNGWILLGSFLTVCYLSIFGETFF